MSQIKLVCVGKIKEEFYRKKFAEYEKNRKGTRKFSLVELPDESIPQKASQAQREKVKEQEGEKILSQIAKSDYVIALCIDGKTLDNRKFQKLILERESRGSQTITFVIGGSLGLSPAVEQRADYRLSFSAMTFPHQLMRLMLMELLVVCDII